MKIILDFDDTIFNTHRLMRDVCTVFESLGFQEEQFWDAYAECKEKAGDFNPEIIIGLLNGIEPFNKIEAKKKINLILDNSKDFVYPDFFDFAKSFNKKDLILLSFGEDGFQGTKIENSKVNYFFSKIIITQKNKTKEIKPIYEEYSEEKIFFIDDKAKQIDEVKKIFPQLVLIKMERPQGGHINTKSKLADYVVGDLNEIKDIIKLLN